MPTRTMGLAVLAGLLMVWAVAGQPPLLPDLSRFHTARHAGSAAFPPALPRLPRPRLRPGSIVATALDRQVAALGRRSPRYPDAIRRRFAAAPDLMRFALDLVPAARAGDGLSDYLIYLTLEECRNYLRLDAESARALFDRVTGALNDLTPEEQAAWSSDYERCYAFAGGEWSALGDALGDERPGAETEYASVWFERAAATGFAPAAAEQALRPGPFAAEERANLLFDALPARDPDVYWLLFAHSGDVPTGGISAPALAWLLLACRAGEDCGEQARWYRGYICSRADSDCEPGLSAVEYYWFAAPADVREQGWQLADRIEADVRSRRWEQLPLPELQSLDTREQEPGVSDSAY
jgi:hypothetical protein